MRWQVLGVGGLLFSLALTGCVGDGGLGGGASTQAPVVKKRMTAAMRSDPYTLSQTLNSAGAGRAPGVSEVEELLHAGLTMEDDRGIRQPFLAEDVPSVENGRWKVFSDGRMDTTWRLRPGLRWHDGTPFTAADLVFTVVVGQDDELPFSRHAGFESFEGVEASDPQTVVVRWKRPYIEADRMFTTAAQFAVPLPKHLLEEPYARDKGTFTQLPYWTEDFVGTGPFLLRQFARGSHLLLGAYDAWPLGRPKIDEIEIKFILDSATLIANLLAGAIEIAFGASFSPDEALLVRDQWRDGTVSAGLSTAWIAAYPQLLNPTPAVISHVDFRRALLHAINRQELVDTFLGGFSTVAQSMIGPHRGEYPAIERFMVRYEYDIARSRGLIEGLGYRRGPGGVFLDTAGTTLAVQIRVTGDDDVQEKAMFAVADFWKRAGINSEPLVMPPQLARDREYRATRPAFEVVRQPTDLRGIGKFRSAGTPLPENRFVGDNRTRYKNLEFDALIDRFSVTIPLPQRVEVLGQIIHHMTDQVIVLDLFYSPSVRMINHRLKNVTASLTWASHLWDVQG